MRLFFFLVCLFRTAFAGSADLSPAPNGHGKSDLNPLADFHTSEPMETPVAGLYQFMQGTQVFYLSSDGRYLIQGEMIDLKKQINLTERARAAERLRILAKLDQQHMITFSPPKPRYLVRIFVDVNCPYCRLIQQKLAEYHARGIAIQYLAFPRSGLHSPDAELLGQVFCATNPNNALQAAEEGHLNDDKHTKCPAVTQQYKAGVAMGIVNTPSIVLEDGALIPGFIAPENLETVLQKHHHP